MLYEVITQNAVGATELDDQHEAHDRDGGDEDDEQLVEIAVDPAPQHGLSGGVDLHPVRRLLAADGLQLIEDLAVVELALSYNFV